MANRWGSMSIDYIESIRKINLFRGLTEESLQDLLASFAWVELTENDLLFSQGDKSRSMYILLSGYLLATLKTQNGHIESIGKIHPGEVVGEMGLLTKRPRSLTIKALTNSNLLELSEENFTTFVKSNPDAVYQMLIGALNRTQRTIDVIAHGKINRHVFMTPTNHVQLENTPFLENLKKTMRRKKETLLLDEKDLSKIYGSKGLDEFLNYLDKLEKDHSTIIYYIKGDNQKINDLLQITKLLLKRTNIVALVAFGNEKPSLSRFNIEILQNFDLQAIEKKLILLWPENTIIKNTRYWLDQANFNLHHHIFLNDISSYERLLRFLQGTSIGLVLSGGGFRGLSHLGVIKALREKNIPIDAIGGTSVGAGTAASYVISKDEQELLYYVEKATDYMRKSLKWTSLTWPVISIYSFTSATNFARMVFMNKRIEDLPIPYFAISCNISNNTEIVHRTHKVWRALRASMAVPGIFPPLIEQGQLLYDGGLLNNFPTDHMREMLGNDATIFGSDLGIMAVDETYYRFPPSLSPIKFLLAKLHRQKSNYIFPPLFRTIFKAMLIGSFPKYQKNIQLANYYIHPDFTGYSPNFLEKSLESEVIQLGYKNTLAIVENWNYDARN
jgi:NTE family protein